MAETLRSNYNSTTDVLEIRVIRIDSVGNTVKEEYTGSPANVGDFANQQIDWYYFSIDNAPSSAIVSNYRAKWADNPSYFASIMSIFFNTTYSKISDLLPSS